MTGRTRTIIPILVHAAALVVASVSVAVAQPAASKSGCNQAASEPVTTVKLPGHPFTIVPTSDGCWLFVSLTSVDPHSNGVAVLRRSAGTITVERLYPIEAQKNRAPLRAGPSGMVMTHDGQLLIAASDDDVLFSPDEQWLYTTSEVAPASWQWPIACPPDRADRAKYPNLEVPEGAVIVVDVRRAFSDPANAVAAKVPAACSPVRLAISGQGDSLWVSARRRGTRIRYFQAARRPADVAAAID